jgi:hypothetical protein
MNWSAINLVSSANDQGVLWFADRRPSGQAAA